MESPAAASGERFPIVPVSPEADGFPFRRELSLAPLVAFACEAAASGAGLGAAVARLVHDALATAPELLRPIDDPAVLVRHRDLVDVLMSRVFPSASWERDFAALVSPFGVRMAYATPSFRRLFLDDAGALKGRLNVDAQSWAMGRLLRAYGMVLAKYYDIELRLDYPLVITTAEGALERHFRFDIDTRFLEVDTLDRPPALSAGDRRRLHEHLADPATLMEVVPPDRFIFRGFAVIKATDITDQEVLSSLKRDLIEKESIVSSTRFARLQLQLQTFFRRPELRLGLAAFQDERVLVLNDGSSLEHRCIFADSQHWRRRDLAGSVFARAAAGEIPLVIDDLATYEPRGAVEQSLLGSGLRSLVVAPLHYQGAIIGVLELGSANPGDFDPALTLKLREVLPLFSMAVRRSLEELEARVQAIIKEKCTAIHPAVEWRFRQAVLDTIERRSDGAADIEPIVFRDVYPLYGAFDIRGSSTLRNLAIQADLGAHLRLARDVVLRARQVKALPILDEVGYRIDRQLAQIEVSLNSGDEVTILAFLRQHAEPLFGHLARLHPSVTEEVEVYRGALDPHLGTIYRKRRDYEESVNTINETISSYLGAEQEMAQGMYPHYFEKQRSDGLDYSIYVGASLVENRPYDTLYLRNLRLWQLLIACGIARQAEALRPRLPLPLEITNLILAHQAPLSIRFRFDEKRFDVDGAYNVRYEVIKKRIDKAIVQATGERLTQTGCVAVVYAQPVEATEYREYLDYLAATGYVAGPVEDLELGELQGVHGLRALRVRVELDAPEPRASAAQAARVLAG